MNLREHNIEILKSLEKIVADYKLSDPLLVSTDESYLKCINNTNSILYIGQETNGWDSDYDINRLEQTYLDVLYNRASNREFWKFLRLMRDQNSRYYNNVIWSNVLVCGKKDSKGTPKVCDDLMNVSLNNLIYLYKTFKPSITVIVAGPNNPYYEIITEFLKYTNSSLTNIYPKQNELLLSDVRKNIHYTYHPNYLNRQGKLLELSKKLNEFYKK